MKRRCSADKLRRWGLGPHHKSEWARQDAHLSLAAAAPAIPRTHSTVAALASSVAAARPRARLPHNRRRSSTGAAGSVKRPIFPTVWAISAKASSNT